VMPIW
jgi:Predicted permease.